MLGQFPSHSVFNHNLRHGIPSHNYHVTGNFSQVKPGCIDILLKNCCKGMMYAV